MTVPLSFWCLFWVVSTEQREARRFMVSPLGCLVQFTHSRKSLAESVNLTRLWFRSLGSWPKLPKPPEVRMDAPPNGSCESVGNVLEERVLENHESKQLLNGWPKPGHYRAVFSIDRPPLLAVRRRSWLLRLTCQTKLQADSPRDRYIQIVARQEMKRSPLRSSRQR